MADFEDHQDKDKAADRAECDGNEKGRNQFFMMQQKKAAHE